MSENIRFYAWATVILVLLMAALIIHVINYSGFNKKQKGWFIATFSAISFCALAEFLLHCGYYAPQFKIILTILTVLQFAVAPCFAMLFAGALGLEKQLRTALIAFGVCLTIGIICAPFGWVFYFDDVGYHRGPAFLIYEITYFGSLIYIIVVLFLVAKRFKNRDTFTIIMVLVVLAAGIIPMTIFSLHIAYLSVGVTSCLCYIFYNDLIQTDTKNALISEQKHVSEMQLQITNRLANLIESRDTETGEHVARTSGYVKTLAEDCLAEGVYSDYINQNFIDSLYTLAPLHDVGKILVSDKILRKPGKLTPEEYEEIKKHATFGGELVRQVLSGISNEYQIEFAADIATFHHEKWDGSGYPKGLKGKEIPLSARIMAIADVFDALVSKRCYKDEVSCEEAFKIIEKDAGTHFDPNLVNVFLKHKDKYEKIKLTHKEIPNISEN